MVNRKPLVKGFKASEVKVVGRKSRLDAFGKKIPLVVAVEGIDGSGKGTQFKELLEALLSRGYKVLTVDFPQYSEFFGKEIGYLLSGDGDVDATTLRPKDMSLWYALDRFHAFKNIDMGDYDVVLMNRSTYSNIGYQTTRVPENEREEFIQWLMDLEFGHLGIPNPSIVFYLDVPPTVSQENVGKKGTRDYVGDKADVYEDSANMLSDARSVYLYLVDKLNNFELVNCMNDEKQEMRSIEDIHTVLLERVLSELD